ncbi:abscission/NoCut checkpoint regulator [Aethina tumida]|uniref:abscission/NoCut checkpoint regulator n=1 Tax=Aethina tumida TaxID=116153 RepID=UPI002148BE38|nr:abscission/NoCut checkpoint regulator [Aethina tumida]
MSCNHCSTKFNFFHKEMGCANCGLSFCNKCLKQKCKVPLKGSGEHNVCRVCFSKITSGSSNQSTSIPPPDAFLKRLESVDNPITIPASIFRQDQKNVNPLKGSSSQVDQKLAQRLEKLKEDKGPPPPSEAELRKRLANLRSDNEYVGGPSRHIYTNDSRTDNQKVDSLLEEFITERDIELAHDPQEEIEARLATLREKGVRPNEGPYISNLHDSGSSEEEIDKITKKIMDEVALEERCSSSMPASSKASRSSEEDELARTSPELPWCVLCNNDAKFRCLDCSGDLYCTECNKEVHKNWGDTDHKVIPYKPK